MASSSEIVLRTSEPPRLRLAARLREISARREVLLNLIRRELKVKYAASVLGAVWSLLNPIVYLAVFSFVTRVLGASIPDFPVYLLSGLLAWNLFSTSVSAGSRSVVDNANLVKKVAFPREILPLTSIGVAIVDYVLQTAVLLLFMLVSGFGFHGPELTLLPIAFVTLLVFSAALTFWLAAANVRYRDVGHLLGIALLVWFWITPIVYAAALVQEELEGSRVLWTLYFVNPLASVVGGFQRALYGVVGSGQSAALFDVSLAWLAAVMLVVLAASLILLRLTWGYFFTRSGDFAEEL
ncbi:MAG: ABC transporter permease [Actinomycetota bacterium]